MDQIGTKCFKKEKQMTGKTMSPKVLFADVESEATAIGSSTISFSMKGFGFGQVVFYNDADGNLRCDNECMSKDTLRKIMNTLVDCAELDNQ